MTFRQLCLIVLLLTIPILGANHLEKTQPQSFATKRQNVFWLVENSVKPEHRKAVICIIAKESDFRPYVISTFGGRNYGLMQVNYGAWHNVFDFNRMLDPAYNIECGYYVLLQCLKQSKGDMRLALKLYNGSWEYADAVLSDIRNFECKSQSYFAKSWLK